MHATDPISVRQLRAARLIEAEQARTGRGAVHSRPRRHRTLADRWPVLRRFSLRRQAASTSHPSFARHDLFAGLDRRSIRRIERSFFVMDVDAGDSLGRQGDVAPEFVVVLSGRVGVSVDGAPLAVLDAGSHFGALPLLDDGPTPYRRASFSVLGPGTVAVASGAQFHDLLATHPVVDGRVRAIADVRRAYLAGRADATPIEQDFPLHLADAR